VLASGYLRAMFVACKVPRGVAPKSGFVICLGPVASCYEFRWPPARALDESNWRSVLRGRSGPDLPAWTGSFLK